MYRVHFFDQANYEFNVSLHSTREAVSAAAGELLQRFEINHFSGRRTCAREIVSLEPLPPKDEVG